MNETPTGEFVRYEDYIEFVSRSDRPMKYTFKTEDEAEARRWTFAGHAYEVICDMREEFRRLLKYAELSEAAAEIVEELQKHLYEKLDDVSIDLERDWY
jgi:hypothetical protein